MNTKGEEIKIKVIDFGNAIHCVHREVCYATNVSDSLKNRSTCIPVMNKCKGRLIY